MGTWVFFLYDAICSLQPIKAFSVSFFLLCAYVTDLRCLFIQF